MKKLARRHVRLKALNNFLLDYNYNYSLMQLLYHAREKINYDKMNQVHDYGFKIDNKSFKLFNFGFLVQNPYKNMFTSTGIVIKKGICLDLIITGEDESLKEIVLGLLDMNIIQIFQGNFIIENIFQERNISFKKQTCYRARNPVVESIYNNGVEYLSPYDSTYYSALAGNLKRKYKLVYGKDYLGDLFFDIDNPEFIKKKIIRGIHNDYKKIKKGFIFDIWLEAEPKMQKIAYYLGLGQANSLGAGFLTYKTGKEF